MTVAPSTWLTLPGTARTGTALAVTAILSVQLGLALAIPLVDRIGPVATAWLRLCWAGLFFAVLLRPGRISRAGLLGGLLLGVVTAGVTVLFMASLAYLPLGTASALEFLGPLGVAMFRGRGRALLPVLPATAGVLLLTRPWSGDVHPAGIALALAAACCWAVYILLTQWMADEVSGLRGLGVSMPVAAVVATLVALPQLVSGRIEHDLEVVLFGLMLAVLVPVVPFSLELLALRRLTAVAFGTLMSLEPAVATAIGFLLLNQVPGLSAVLGVGCVVLAGIGAERTGARNLAG